MLLINELDAAIERCRQMYGRLPAEGESFSLSMGKDDNVTVSGGLLGPTIVHTFLSCDEGKLRLRKTLVPMLMGLAAQVEEKTAAEEKNDGPKDQVLVQTERFDDPDRFPKG